MDNHGVVKIGDLEKTPESHSTVKSKCTADIPEGLVREGADELTLRRDARMLRTCIDTTNVGDSGREPLVHQDWHAMLSGPLQRRRRTGIGELVSKVCRAARSSQP